jgi:hypothetical protein
MTSRISVCLAEGPTVCVVLSSTSCLQDIKISCAGVPLTECLQQRDCNGVVNILNVHLRMNHVTDPTRYPAGVCAGNVSGIDMVDA